MDGSWAGLCWLYSDGHSPWGQPHWAAHGPSVLGSPPTRSDGVRGPFYASPTGWGQRNLGHEGADRDTASPRRARGHLQGQRRPWGNRGLLSGDQVTAAHTGAGPGQGTGGAETPPRCGHCSREKAKDECVLRQRVAGHVHCQPQARSDPTAMSLGEGLFTKRHFCQAPVFQLFPIICGPQAAAPSRGRAGRSPPASGRDLGLSPAPRLSGAVSSYADSRALHPQQRQRQARLHSPPPPPPQRPEHQRPSPHSSSAPPFMARTKLTQRRDGEGKIATPWPGGATPDTPVTLITIRLTPISRHQDLARPGNYTCFL